MGLFDLNHSFMAPHRDVHNTLLRMKHLAEVIDTSHNHPLTEDEASKLGETVLTEWENGTAHSIYPSGFVMET